MFLLDPSQDEFTVYIIVCSPNPNFPLRHYVKAPAPKETV